MIKEVYCCFEVAKLLKEKGFDQNCATYYLDGQVWRHYHGEVIPKGKQIYAAPSQAMAMKWLREKYYIYADPIKQGNYNDCSEYYTWIVARMGIIHRNPSVADKLSYEEAVEAALKYSLENLI